LISETEHLITKQALFVLVAKCHRPTDSQEGLLPKAPSEVGGDERGAQKVGNRPTSMVEPAARREPKHYQRRRLVAAQNRPP
jgi:hypothetical protein